MGKNCNGLCEAVKRIEDQMVVGDELSLCIARDNLKKMCEEIRALGYIPEKDYVVFKLLGEAYIKAGGNHGFSEMYEHIIKDYEVK